MFELLIIGGVAFWIVVGILGLILLAAVHNDAPAPANFALLVFVAACLILGNGWRFACDHSAFLAVAVVVYPLIGLAWSVLRWMLFLDYVLERYKTQKAAYLKQHPNVTPVQLSAAFYHFGDGLVVDDKTGEASVDFEDNLGRIASWVAYWPVSIVDQLLGNMLARLCRWAVRQWQRLFESLAAHWFKGV